MSNENEPRAPTLADFKLLLDSLNRHGVEYLLVGGFALLAHGYSRMTMDIDILVPPTAESAARVKEALLVLPDKAARGIDPAWFAEGGTIRVADEFIVDIMFNACGETYESLKQYAEVIDMDGTKVHTVNIKGLLLTKRTAREKDVPDRLLLERALELARKERGSQEGLDR